jgi:fatty-acyl-CoA synthase
LNVLNNGFFIGERMKLTEHDSVCIPVPLFHCFGLVLGNMAAITHGSKIVYPSAGFDPKAVMDAVQQERCTALHGVPTMFIAELELPDFHNYDISSLRTGIMAGTTCPMEVMRKVVTKMHMKGTRKVWIYIPDDIVDVTICYGMTETSPVSFQTEVDSPELKRIETVGRIHPHIEVRYTFLTL